MKDYSEMSDFEINRAVAIALGCKVRSSSFGIDYYFPDGNKEYNPCAPHGPVEDFNPCNSWADAGPIIEGCGIGLRRQSNGVWAATQPGGAYPQYGNLPLRTAMIVYLMMHDKGEE